LRGEIEVERYTGSSSFYTVRLTAPSGGFGAAADPVTVEVAMPGTAAGLSGACVVRPAAQEPPPRVFPAGSTGAGP